MEKSDQNQIGSITSKMHELLGCMCVVTITREGDRRGMIERIESLIIGKDFPESFERSQFKVLLTSGDAVIVQGSAISEIESTVAAGGSPSSRKKPGIGARGTKTKKKPAEKRRSTTSKVTKAAGKTKDRSAKGRAKARKAGKKNGRGGNSRS
jgi:hypothetical protein